MVVIEQTGADINPGLGMDYLPVFCHRYEQGIIQVKDLLNLLIKKLMPQYEHRINRWLFLKDQK